MGRPAAGPGAWILLGVVAMFACLLLSTGCRSMGKPASASFASVDFTNCSPAQIREASLAVFRAEGYSVVAPGPGDMVFERESSRKDQMAYGTWLGETAVYVRVKALIIPLTETRYRLQCHAYMVRNKNDPLFEEETKLANFRGGPYQEVLDKVAERLR